VICDRCYQPLDQGEHGLYRCPLQPRRGVVVWADDIPGGIEIANGICNEDGTPKRYYSKSEIRRACEVKGVMPYHDVYAEGGNRMLSDARQREDWLKSDSAKREKRWRDEARAEKHLTRSREAARR
jgi:hypothetical protein